MKIFIHPSQARLASLHKGVLTFYDISGPTPQKLTSAKAPQGHRIAACGAYTAVLAGKSAPAGASISSAKILRFGWDGSELPSIPVGEVDKCGLSLNTDGSRLVVTNWRACEVTLYDTASAKPLGAAGESIPSGASISPDGTKIICGTADQGSGAILWFDPSKIEKGKMAMEKLKPPKPSPGLDDAPYFSVWSKDGSLVAISNQSWGGRGLFVYDGISKTPLWSMSLDAGGGDEEDEEAGAENWYPMPLGFSEDGSMLFAAEVGAIRAYRARSGEKLKALPAKNGDGSSGFAVQSSQNRLWLAGDEPEALAFDSTWLAAPAPTKTATKKAAAKTTAKKKTAATKKTAAKKNAG